MNTRSKLIAAFTEQRGRLTDRIIDNIIEYAKGSLVTSLSANSDSWGMGGILADRILKWYLTTPYSKYSGNLAITGRWDSWEENNKPNTLIGVGHGKHFFLFNGVLGWIDYSQVEQKENFKKEKNDLHVSLLTTDRKLMMVFLEEVNRVTARDPSEKKVEYHNWCDGWNSRGDLQHRAMETVYVEDEIKDYLINKIQRFIDNRQWYIDRGLPYKLVVMMSGPPGNGKTTLVRALAHLFKYDVFEMPISSATDQNMSIALSSVKKGFVLIEDIHAAEALLQEQYRRKDFVLDSLGLTLSGYLAAFDGVATLDGTIVFISANDPHKLATSVTRKGRVDCNIHIGNMNDTMIRKFARQMYADHVGVDKVLESYDPFPPTSGSNVYSAYSENYDSLGLFLHDIQQQRFDVFEEEFQMIEDMKAKQLAQSNEPVPLDDPQAGGSVAKVKGASFKFSGGAKDDERPY